MEGFLELTESRGSGGYADVSLAMVCLAVEEQIWKVHPEQRQQRSNDVWLGGGEGGREEQLDKRGGKTGKVQTRRYQGARGRIWVCSRSIGKSLRSCRVRNSRGEMPSP